MNNLKPWYASTTVWGGVAACIGGVATMNHFTLSPADIAEIASDFGSIAGAVGGLLAIYGRVAATKKIIGGV